MNKNCTYKFIYLVFSTKFWNGSILLLPLFAQGNGHYINFFPLSSHHAATFKLPRGDKLRRHSMVREIRASSSEQRLLTKWNLDTARRRWLLTSRPQSETKNSQVSHTQCHRLRSYRSWISRVPFEIFFFSFFLRSLIPRARRLSRWRSDERLLIFAFGDPSVR